MLLKCMRATALTLLFMLTACGGFDTASTRVRTFGTSRDR